MNTNPPKPPKVVVAPEWCNSYLTAGKEYAVESHDGNWDDEFGYMFNITDDTGHNCVCVEIKCGHIHKRNWIIKEREQ